MEKENYTWSMKALLEALTKEITKQNENHTTNSSSMASICVDKDTNGTGKDIEC